jgi:hypothetical protein
MKHSNKQIKFICFAGRMEKVKIGEDMNETFIYSCALCGDRRRSLKELIPHLRLQHKQKEPSVCRFCSDVFYTNKC